MTGQHRQQPSRLFIPPMLNSQLANTVDTRAMFSPALQTAHQPGFPPLPSAHPFGSGFPLQTPVQTSFFPHNPPPRQIGHGHRVHGSIAHIPSMGIQPSIPMTPFGSQFPPQMMHGGVPPSPSAQPFVPKSRRTPSMIGGPPKAQLGGPNRKVSPLPPSLQVAAIAEKVKAKKIPVKIPVESEREGNDMDTPRKSLWSRQPVPTPEIESQTESGPPEISSAEVYPDDEYRKHLPLTVDVFLPSKAAWDEMKQREIDEKLEKLGIERRFGHSEGFNMRGRAASISSPADPALLTFKLNMLQKQQSASNSMSPSPQPHSASISPNPSLLPRVQTHGQTMSLAQPPILSQQMPNGQVSMSSGSPIGQDGVAQPVSPLGIFAPQGRVPAQLNVPSAPSRAENQPDFIRGFGLDIPEEEEEEEEEELETRDAGTGHADRTITDQPNDLEDNAPTSGAVQISNVQANVAGANEGTHTRHVSRISVALSVGSMSKNLDETMVGHSRHSSLAVPVQGTEQKSESLVDALNEWTGSESDLSGDQESIGEWSNPSDEERARQERLQRRYLRRMNRDAQEAPRRLPEFPKPPRGSYIPRKDEEDIISNPSDEGHLTFNDHAMNGLHYSQPVSDPNSRGSRPLPPIPHSRDPSYQFSYYGSLPSQSPDHFASGQASAPDSRPASTHHTKTPSLSSTKKELNPFAKPFVFDGLPGFNPTDTAAPVPASTRGEVSTSLAQVTTTTHFRTPSTGAPRKLNAAAQEFKPGAFTFRLPEGGPKLSFPNAAPETSRPLPDPPVIGVTTAVQGREKRQRTGTSEASFDTDNSDDEGVHDTMASFRFPIAPEAAIAFARSAPTSPSPAVNRSVPNLNSSTKPGTFSGFSNLPPTLPPLLGQDQSSPDGLSTTDFPSMNATRGSALGDDQRSLDVTLPSLQKQKRAPIPLDFKHPVSTNMVPAGLFKNLGTGESDAPRNPRGHNGGFDFSESRSDVSLDDLSVPAISRKATRRIPKPEDLDVTEDEFDGASDASNNGASDDEQASEVAQPHSPTSRSSMLPPDVASYSQGLRLENRLESIINHKIDLLREDLSAQFRGSGFISSPTDELVREAMAMFRTQLHESAAKSLGDISMDAHGELDLEMIRGIIEQGHEDIRKIIRDDIDMILRSTRDTATPESILDLIRSFQELRASVLASGSHVVERLDAIEAAAPHKNMRSDREGLVVDILSALAPHLAAIRTEPIDYEGLTVQLSQAVKPHISQLIDLASDKRETAGLIVEQLMPVLQSLASDPREFDSGNLVSEISATVNRIIAPIDAYSIKEQVADLVVERLDSRLATRDNDAAVNFNSLKSKLVEEILPLLGQLTNVSDVVRALSSEQSALSSVTREASSKQVDTLRYLAGLSDKLSNLTETLATVQSHVSQQNNASDAWSEQLGRIESSIKATDTSGAGLSQEEKEEILSVNREVRARLAPVSESIASALISYDAKHTELLSRLQAMDDSSKEVCKLTTQNTDLQTQLGRARSQHGHIRVQYDELASKAVSVEEERDQLRIKVEELNAAALAHVAEFAGLEARNSEQERAMHAALDRLKISDVNAQTYQERIADLEKTNREMLQENQQLKLKINRLEMQAEFAAKDKESAAQAVKLLQEDRNRLATQESHWEDFRNTAEQIENLANLMRNAESDEIVELRRVRDRSMILEGEHEALKRRFKEQESKIANIERSSATARQDLAQAQLRSTDWERKAREYEGEVERLATALEQAEQAKNQVGADYSLAKLQLEGIEDRLAKAMKVEERLATIRHRVSSEIDMEQRGTQWSGPRERTTSTEFQPSEPPTPRMNGKSLPNTSVRSNVVSPQDRTTSTWDSMHAPKVVPSTYADVPSLAQIRRSSRYNSRAASPTASVVSTVTRGEDGWFS